MADASDKTDALVLVRRSQLIELQAEVSDDASLAHERIRSILAAQPAASVDVETLRAIADGIDPATGTMGCKEVANLLRKLIDSAGGAKGACGTCGGRGWIDDGHEQDDGRMVSAPEDCPDCTPQPAEGDGAVADALTAVNDAANDARHARDYKKANALVKARITLWRAATAQQPVAVDGYSFDVIEEAWGDTVPLTKERFDLFRKRLAELRQFYAAPTPGEPT